MLSRLGELIWADWIWFPEGHGWADLKDHDGLVFPKTQDLWATIPIALCFLVLRQIFERTVATPLASLLGVSDKQRVRARPNPVLESYFCSTSKHPTQTSIESLSKQTGCSVRQVQRWFRRRRNQDRPSKLKKFQEASWRFTFYLLAFFAGLAVLIDKPWFYDMKQMWDGFPKMPLLPSQYWYYVIELGFYVSLLFSIASDVKRKSGMLHQEVPYELMCDQSSVWCHTLERQIDRSVHRSQSCCETWQTFEPATCAISCFITTAHKCKKLIF